MTPYTVLLAGYLGVFAVALLLDGYARAGHGPIRPIATVPDAAVATPGRPMPGVGGLVLGGIPLPGSLTITPPA